MCFIPTRSLQKTWTTGYVTCFIGSFAGGVGMDGGLSTDGSSVPSRWTRRRIVEFQWFLIALSVLFVKIETGILTECWSAGLEKKFKTRHWSKGAHSYRPGKAFAISAHLLPKRPWSSRITRSSSSVHGVFLMSGLRWLCHLHHAKLSWSSIFFDNLSRHCFPIRPFKCAAIIDQRFAPNFLTRSTTFSSSWRKSRLGVKIRQCKQRGGKKKKPSQIKNRKEEGSNFFGPRAFDNFRRSTMKALAFLNMNLSNSWQLYLVAFISLLMG